MRLNTAFIEMVRKNSYKPGSETERALATIVAYRQMRGLDERFPVRPENYDEKRLEYEVEKLVVVFGVIASQNTKRGRLKAIDMLKKDDYPAAEVDEIVREYELLKPKRPAHKTESGKDWIM